MLLMRWCTDAADALLLLMLLMMPIAWCCWYAAAAADMLLLLMMHWCYWSNDAPVALMLLMLLLMIKCKLVYESILKVEVWGLHSSGPQASSLPLKDHKNQSFWSYDWSKFQKMSMVFICSCLFHSVYSLIQCYGQRSGSVVAGTHGKEGEGTIACLENIWFHW